MPAKSKVRMCVRRELKFCLEAGDVEGQKEIIFLYARAAAAYISRAAVVSLAIAKV